MRKIVLGFIIIITLLPLAVLSREAANVPFIDIPGHEKQGTILFFDYDYLYKHIPQLATNMKYYRGHNVAEEKYEQWLVANVGYFMYEYNAWYVYIEDPYTFCTDDEVMHIIANASRTIDITYPLFYELQHDHGQDKYGTLSSGRNIYVLNSNFLNEWPLHLLY